MVARLSNEGIYKSGVASVTAQKADETTPAAMKEEGEVKKPSCLRIKADSWGIKIQDVQETAKKNKRVATTEDREGSRGHGEWNQEKTKVTGVSQDQRRMTLSPVKGSVPLHSRHTDWALAHAALCSFCEVNSFRVSGKSLRLLRMLMFPAGSLSCASCSLEQYLMYQRIHRWAP